MPSVVARTSDRLPPDVITVGVIEPEPQPLG